MSKDTIEKFSKLKEDYNKLKKKRDALISKKEYLEEDLSKKKEEFITMMKTESYDEAFDKLKQVKTKFEKALVEMEQKIAELGKLDKARDDIDDIV